MRPALVAFLLLLRSVAYGGDAADSVRHLPAAAIGHAYWAADGRSFLMADVDGEHLLRFDRLGKPLGRLSIAAAARGLQLDLSVATSSRRALSPDGKRLLFLGTTEGKQMPGIWVLDLATGRAGSAMATGTDRFVTTPEWFPDGKRVLVSVIGGSANLHSEVIDTTTGLRGRLCPALPGVVASRVMPDGTLIVASDRLYRTNAACDALVAISNHYQDATDHPLELALSPSTKSLVVLLIDGEPTPDSATSLWLVPSTGAPVRIGQAAWPQAPLVWIDEEHVLFEQDRGPEAAHEHTLMKYSVADHRSTPVIAPARGCSDGNASAPERGGPVVFQRACTSAKGSAAMILSN